MQYVPDYFVKQQQLRHFYDGNDKFFSRLNWYEGSQKRKAQKAKIKNKLLPVAWNNGGTGVLLRMKKKKQKNCGHKNGPFLCLMAGYKIFFTP